MVQFLKGRSNQEDLNDWSGLRPACRFDHDVINGSGDAFRSIAALTQVDDECNVRTHISTTQLSQLNKKKTLTTRV